MSSGPLAELRSLKDAELVADFHCREGWSRLGARWRGVRLRTLLALAGVADAVGYVTVASGEYTRRQALQPGCKTRCAML